MYIAYMAIGMILEMVGFIILLRFRAAGSFSAFLILSIHILACLSFSWGLLKGSNEKVKRGWGLLGLVSSLFIPFYGFLGVLIVFLVMNTVAKKRGVFEDYREQTKYNKIVREKMQEINNVMGHIHEDLEIEPIVDILRGSDVEQKRGALEVLARLKNRDSIQTLLDTLRDRNPEVRLYASTSLARIEDEINKKIMEAKEKLKKNPYSYLNYTFLADQYYHYFSIGLLDEVISKYYLNLAIKEYKTSLDLNPNQPEVLLNLGKAHLARKDFLQAKEFFDQAILLKPEAPEGYLQRCETFYNLRRYEDIAKDCRKIRELMPQDERIKEIVDWWTEA